MKSEELKDYLIKDTLDIDKLIDDFYGYVYMIVKNGVSIYLTNEDIEEIISDVFVAIWKNSKNLLETTDVKHYLAGATKNIIKNKYRSTKVDFSISDYEERLVDSFNIESSTEENEKNSIISSTLKTLKPEEYRVFILFYYKSKSIKEISKQLNISISNIKTILHRVRKKIKILIKLYMEYCQLVQYLYCVL